MRFVLLSPRFFFQQESLKFGHVRISFCGWRILLVYLILCDVCSKCISFYCIVMALEVTLLIYEEGISGLLVIFFSFISTTFHLFCWTFDLCPDCLRPFLAALTFYLPRQNRLQTVLTDWNLRTFGGLRARCKDCLLYTSRCV